MPPTERVRLVVTVMAYPAITKKHGESVCVAGVRTDRLMEASWVRLFPFTVRDLPQDERIHKWDEIELDVIKAKSDHRPESYTPIVGSVVRIGHLDTAHRWRARRGLLAPLPDFETMRQVEIARENDAVSLAVVRTGEVLDVEITKKSAKDIQEFRDRVTADAAKMDLFSFDDPKLPLEAIPFDFHYIVRYPDEAEPRRLKIIDWEINQSWRKWRHDYDSPEQQIRHKWLEELCGVDRDPRFFVANMHIYPSQFLMLGVFWPPKV